jgi:hypothetical protein
MWYVRISGLPLWRLQLSGIKYRVVSFKQTNVSDVRTSPIINVISLIIETVHSSETLICVKKTTRSHVPEGCNLLKSFVAVCLRYDSVPCTVKAYQNQNTIFSQTVIAYLYKCIFPMHGFNDVKLKFHAVFTLTLWICGDEQFISRSLCSSLTLREEPTVGKERKAFWATVPLWLWH